MRGGEGRRQQRRQQPQRGRALALLAALLAYCAHPVAAAAAAAAATGRHAVAPMSAVRSGGLGNQTGDRPRALATRATQPLPHFGSYTAKTNDTCSLVAEAVCNDGNEFTSVICLSGSICSGGLYEGLVLDYDCSKTQAHCPNLPRNGNVMLYVIAPPNSSAFTPAEFDLQLATHVIYDSSEPCVVGTDCTLGATPQAPIGYDNLAAGVAFLRGGGARKVLLSVGGPKMTYEHSKACWSNCLDAADGFPPTTPDALAQQLVNLAQDAGFDGFELAMPPGFDISWATASFAVALVRKLKQKRPAAILSSSATATALGSFPTGNYVSKFLSPIRELLNFSAVRYFGDGFAAPIYAQKPIYAQNPNFPIVFKNLVMTLSGTTNWSLVTAEGCSKAVASFTNVNDIVPHNFVVAEVLCKAEPFSNYPTTLNQLMGLCSQLAPVNAGLWNTDGKITEWLFAVNADQGCFENPLPQPVFPAQYSCLKQYMQNGTHFEEIVHIDSANQVKVEQQAASKTVFFFANKTKYVVDFTAATPSVSPPALRLPGFAMHVPARVK
jgi:hypothetical protein